MSARPLKRKAKPRKRSPKPVPRGARFTEWRPLGKAGTPWPEWVGELKERSGVYEIRDRSTEALLYVGESHTNKLYGTITRHFQSWSGPTKGATYARGSVEVRVKVTRPSLAVPAQNLRIEVAEPRDNVLSPEPEPADTTADAPF